MVNIPIFKTNIMNNFRELKVWNNGITLVKQVYTTTKKYPKEELFGLTNQMRRCAISIPSNIAEGAGRKSNNEFEHFLYIALGSCFELETQLIISKELEFITSDKFDNLQKEIVEVEKMIRGLQKKLDNK